MSANLPWEKAWEEHKDRLAKPVHDAWMQTKIAQGFADHVFEQCNQPTLCTAPERCHKYLGCDRPADKHHKDMLPFEELSDEVKAYDYATALTVFPVAFEIGYLRGVNAMLDELESKGVLTPDHS